jgi:tetratricopeptide (TPR) repeat protein
MKRRAPRISAGIALLLLSLVSPAAAIEEADRLWLVGERAFADGLYPASRRALERFVAQYPKDSRQPEAVLLLSKARLQAGDAQAALDGFKRAQMLTPVPGRPQEARFWEAETLFRLKRFLDARDAYDAVVRADAAGPLAPEAFYGRAWSDLELKHSEAAVAGFRELLSAFPDHALAPSAALQAARALADLKRTTEALALLDDIPRKYSTSPLVADAQFWSGWIKVTSGTDPTGGTAELSTFVAAHPNHPQAATARGLIPQALARSANQADRLKAYKMLVEQNPPTAEALSTAVDIASGLGRAAERDAAWKRLSTDFPSHPLTGKKANELASAAFKQKNWKSAVSYATLATKCDDHAVRSEAWLLVGESELKQKRFAEAAKAFESVGTVPEIESSVRFRALAGLGLAREEQQSWKAALSAYEAVVNRSPDATLRDWARERVAAVKARMAKPDAPAAPKTSPNSTRPSSSGNATKPAAKKDSRP